MNFIRKQWAFSFRANSGKSLAAVLIYHLLTALVVSIIFTVIAAIPAVAELPAAGLLAWRIFGGLIVLYYLVGAVLAVLHYLKIVK